MPAGKTRATAMTIPPMRARLTWPLMGTMTGNTATNAEPMIGPQNVPRPPRRSASTVLNARLATVNTLGSMALMCMT